MSVRRWFLLSVICILSGVTVFWSITRVNASELTQIPTVAIPTVTGPPVGAIIIVNSDQEQINVRSGPNAIIYPAIGVLVAGQQAPALGRTVGGDWIQISYPGVAGGVGWVYSPLVTVRGDLPIVAPPPTPTPRTTPTIDPTLAAQFIVDIPPTRLPTFTAPPPLVVLSFPSEENKSPFDKIPMGFVITGLGVLGLFGILISLLRGK